VAISNYELPQGVRLQISARRLGDEGASSHFSANTDDRGRFTFEGLAPGEYELSAGSAFVSVSGVQTPRLSHATQKAIVSNGKESEVILVLKAIEK
jgi:hypothetical protein